MSQRYQELLAEAANCHAAARMLPGASAQNLEASAPSADRDFEPKGAGGSLADKYTGRLEQFVADFLKDLREITHSPERPDADQQVKRYRDFLIERYEGTHEDDVARFEKMSVSYVRQVRSEAGRRPVDGKIKAKAA